jgi:Ca2+-binding EF-hand superfamily protein
MLNEYDQRRERILRRMVPASLQSKSTERMSEMKAETPNSMLLSEREIGDIKKCFRERADEAFTISRESALELFDLGDLRGTLLGDRMFHVMCFRDEKHQRLNFCEFLAGRLLLWSRGQPEDIFEFFFCCFDIEERGIVKSRQLSLVLNNFFGQCHQFSWLPPEIQHIAGELSHLSDTARREAVDSFCDAAVKKYGDASSRGLGFDGFLYVFVFVVNKQKHHDLHMY